MNKIKQELRQKLQGQLSDYNTQLDVDNAYSVVKEKAVLFSLFCAENYIHLHSDRWIKYSGDDREFETEEIFKIWENEIN